MIMKLAVAGRRLAIDVPHLCLVTAIAGWCIWYFLDSRASSPSLQNLILIEPVVLLVAALWLVILAETVRFDPAPSPLPAEDSHRAPLGGTAARRIFGSMALLALYVLTMSRIGLDVATVLYVGASLWLLGERRPLLLVGVPLVFTAIVVFTFDAMLATPLPLLLIPAP